MRTDLLKKNIYDTVKEWQMKIGDRKGSMKLYYPAASLKALLGLETGATEAQVAEALTVFSEEVREQLGKIGVSHEGDRYCMDIPEEGCGYIAEKVPDPEFLKLFLKTITTKGCSMDMIRGCFSTYAGKNGAGYIEADHTAEGLGRDFCFDKKGVDDYVYCVEIDDFGLTYHRFTRTDYEALQNGEK